MSTNSNSTCSSTISTHSNNWHKNSRASVAIPNAEECFPFSKEKENEKHFGIQLVLLVLFNCLFVCLCCACYFSIGNTWRMGFGAF